MRRFGFAKNRRLVNNEQFRAVLSHNVCCRSGLLGLYAAPNDCGYSRLGISIGRHCGNAVVRNRLKRLVRESFRQNQDRIPAGFDYLVLVARRRGRKGEDLKRAVRCISFEEVSSRLLTMVREVVRRLEMSGRP